MTLPAWEELPPEYDDRPERIVKIKDPANVKRGKNNRSRGQRTELTLSRLFEDAGFTVYRQGGPNRRDMVISRGDLKYSVESKSLKGRKLTPAFSRAAWEQACRQCGPEHRPLVVVRETTANKSVWTVCWPDGNESLAEFLRK